MNEDLTVPGGQIPPTENDQKGNFRATVSQVLRYTLIRIFGQNADTGRFLQHDFPLDPVKAGLFGSGTILAPNSAKKRFFRA